MLNHSSATPHIIKSTNNNTLSRQKAGADGRRQGHKNTPSRQEAGADGRRQRQKSTTKTTISNAVKRRARSLIKDKSIDAQSRAIIRYGLAANDPFLTELVRRVDAGEPIFDKAGRLIIKTSA